MVAFAKEVIQRLGTVMHDYDFVDQIALFKRSQGEQLILGVVLHQENYSMFH
jgi:hypothetical protein